MHFMWKICKIGARNTNLCELGEKNQKLVSPLVMQSFIKCMFNINVSDERIEKGINVCIAKA